MTGIMKILSGFQMAVNSLDCNKLLSLGPILTNVKKIFVNRLLADINL